MLSYAASQDYKGFYQQEISLRKALRYPPFADVCQAVFTGRDPARAMAAAQWFMARVQALAGEAGLPVIGIGPAPCAIAKLRDDYRIKAAVQVPGRPRLPRYAAPGAARIRRKQIPERDRRMDGRKSVYDTIGKRNRLWLYAKL